jgi:lipopolysaccharide biosynthesis glycosyltransferase
MKKLIYMSIFYNKNYLILLELLLDSLIRFGNLDNSIDILILTHNSFINELNDISKRLNITQVWGITLHIELLNATTIPESKWSRFKIFNLNKDVTVYDKILYLDIDILIQKDIKPLFDLELENKLYARQSGDIGADFFGHFLFKEWIQNSQIYLNLKTPAFCSGVLLFKPCLEIKNLFQETLNHILSYQNSGKPFGTCVDQPFINFNTIIRNLHEIDSLTEFVSNNPDINTRKETIFHFAGNSCGFDIKYKRMKIVFDFLVNR